MENFSFLNYSFMNLDEDIQALEKEFEYLVEWFNRQKTSLEETDSKAHQNVDYLMSTKLNFDKLKMNVERESEEVAINEKFLDHLGVEVASLESNTNQYAPNRLQNCQRKWFYELVLSFDCELKQLLEERKRLNNEIADHRASENQLFYGNQMSALLNQLLSAEQKIKLMTLKIAENQSNLDELMMTIRNNSENKISSLI